MDKRLFFLLNMAQRKLFNHVDKICEEQLDAPVTQLAALMFICKNSGCQQKDLSRALSLNKSGITTLVRRMEKNGLIERKSSATDGRASKLYPTPGGLKKVMELGPYLEQLNQGFAEAFTADEIATVLKFLNFILKRF